MYLVDTSVWIDFLREKNNAATKMFTLVQEQDLPFGITGIIYQEILQGAASKKDFDAINEVLSTQRFFHAKDEIETYAAAANIYSTCRRKGITIRSSIDCLIAQICIEHNLVLIHNDADFKRIQSIVPDLKLA